jgi:hypothetical protein
MAHPHVALQEGMSMPAWSSASRIAVRMPFCDWMPTSTLSTHA